jgi:ribosome-associated toxin RatA of RatAB toxin-antitoxin module
MQTVRKSVIVPHACRAMYDLVERCERYPEFLPWCSGAEVLERTTKETVARLDIDYRGLKTHITTRNRKTVPRRITLELVDGPFQSLQGDWKFAALGESGCRVELTLEYDLKSGALDRLLAPVFGHIAETMVERFVERAAQDAA